MQDIAELLRSAYQEALEAPGDLDLDAVSRKIDRALYSKARAGYVEYLREHGRHEIREQLRGLDRSRRGQMRHRLARGVLLSAVDAITGGSTEDRLVALDQWRVDVGGGIRRPVMELTGAEHLAEAVKADQLAATAGMVGAFHRYIGQQTAADSPTSMTRQEVADLWRRIAGEAVMPTEALAA